MANGQAPGNVPLAFGVGIPRPPSPRGLFGSIAGDIGSAGAAFFRELGGAKREQAIQKLREIQTDLQRQEVEEAKAARKAQDAFQQQQLEFQKKNAEAAAALEREIEKERTQRALDVARIGVQSSPLDLQRAELLRKEQLKNDLSQLAATRLASGNVPTEVILSELRQAAGGQVSELELAASLAQGAQLASQPLVAGAFSQAAPPLAPELQTRANVILTSEFGQMLFEAALSGRSKKDILRQVQEEAPSRVAEARRQLDAIFRELETNRATTRATTRPDTVPPIPSALQRAVGSTIPGLPIRP